MRALLVIASLLAPVAAVHAQAGGRFEVRPNAIARGGGASGGGSFELQGTLGQHDAGRAQGGGFVLLGGFQSAASTVTIARCLGDCGADGSIEVDELIRMVRLSLDGDSADACPFGDGDADGRVSLHEVVAAVRRALIGCL
jgi:hypothetical protein